MRCIIRVFLTKKLSAKADGDFLTNRKRDLVKNKNTDLPLPLKMERIAWDWLSPAAPVLVPEPPSDRTRPTLLSNPDTVKQKKLIERLAFLL